MSPFDFDFFVVGGGSGGIRAARVAAGHGARVGIAERQHWGGTCVNAGCIPKKLLSMAAHFASDFQEAGAFGWELTPPTHSWQRLLEHKDREIVRLNELYRRLLTERGCMLFEDHATLVDPHTLMVGDRRITADKVLLAVGGWPVLPGTPGVHEYASTSNDVFNIAKMPRSVLLVGGGYVGVEFAGIFAGLGAQVALVCRSDELLKAFDVDLGRHLATQMLQGGIDVRLATDVIRVDRESSGLVVQLTDDRPITADCVVYAAGRSPNTAKLGIDALGIATDDQGAIVVDQAYRTSIDNIYAVGDVTDRFNLTPTAVAEGEAVAETLFGDALLPGQLCNVPSAVFSDPPIGAVGLSEADARLQFGEIDIYRKEFRPLRHTVSGRPQTTMQKLVVERATGRVLGCHMIGLDAPEIIQGFAVALNCGATKAMFDASVGVHPTSAEEFISMRQPV